MPTDAYYNNCINYNVPSPATFLRRTEKLHYISERKYIYSIAAIAILLSMHDGIGLKPNQIE